jgi:hypothetical protein
MFIMGFIRGFLLFFVGSLLFISLFAGNILLTFSMSLEHDNVQLELSSFVSDMLTGEIENVLGKSGISNSDLNLTKEVEETIEIMQNYCQNKSIETNYVFSYEEYTFEVPCEEINQSVSAVVESGVENAVDEIYYKEYNCEMWTCISDGEPYVLVSEKAKDYWGSKYYTVLLITLGLAILTFFITEKKKNFPILLGIMMVVSALPFVKAQSLIGVLSNSTYGSLAGVFISEAPKVFWIMFIPGILLIILGIAFHTVMMGTKLTAWLDKKEAESKVKNEKEKVVKKK